jgi:hypothetical protein
VGDEGVLTLLFPSIRRNARANDSDSGVSDRFWTSSTGSRAPNNGDDRPELFTGMKSQFGAVSIELPEPRSCVRKPDTAVPTVLSGTEDLDLLLKLL